MQLTLNHTLYLKVSLKKKQKKNGKPANILNPSSAAR